MREAPCDADGAVDQDEKLVDVDGHLVARPVTFHSLHRAHGHVDAAGEPRRVAEVPTASVPRVDLDENRLGRREEDVGKARPMHADAVGDPARGLLRKPVY